MLIEARLARQFMRLKFIPDDASGEASPRATLKLDVTSLRDHLGQDLATVFKRHVA